MAMSPRLMRPIASGPSYHPEALAWKAAALANGGTVSPTTMQAVSDLCQAVDDNSLRDRFIRLNLFCGSNVQAAVVPLYRGPSPTGTQYGDAVDGNIGPFVTGTGYTQTTGFVTDSSSYLDTGMSISNMLAAGANYDEVHVSMWLKTVDTGSTAEMGGLDYWACAGDGGDGLYLSAGTSGYMQSAPNGGDYDFSAGSLGAGLHLAVRSSGSPFYTLNGIDQTITSNSGGGVAWSSAATVIGLLVLGYAYTDEACNIYRLPSGSGHQVGGYSYGLGMSTSGMRETWYDILLAFQQAIGRSA